MKGRCSNCGREIEGSSLFCDQCGQPVGYAQSLVGKPLYGIVMAVMPYGIIGSCVSSLTGAGVLLFGFPWFGLALIGLGVVGTTLVLTAMSRGYWR